MVELVLMAAGVCPPETLDSLPYAEFTVEGECRHDGLSATVEDGKKLLVGGH
jgi:hypothetical protein